MKKIVILLFILFNIFILNGCSNQNNEKFETVIFYSPHADDEVLSMGASILKAKEEKKKVIVVLLSKGLASSAYHSVNAKLTAEGDAPLSPKEFGAARVKEFKRSVTSLGVKEKDIHVYNLTDGNFSTKETEKIMKKFEKQYPDAEHHAMSFHDPHHDHATTGEALKTLVTDGKIKTAIYHIPIQEFENLNYEQQDTVPSTSVKKYDEALSAYGVWSPNEGFYSIGKNSVTDYFSIAKKERSSRWHK